MRIGELAERLGTTPHAIRFYERSGLVPAPPRSRNGYREYAEADLSRLRMLIGLRQLDLPLAQAAEIASLCADGRCGEVSNELRTVLTDKRAELRRNLDELHYLDGRLAHLVGQLEAGEAPRPLIALQEGGRR